MATSKIKGGVQKFNCTRSSNLSTGIATGFYDSSSGIVRINFTFNSNDAITTDTTLYTIPSAYRPTETATGSAITWNGSIVNTGAALANSDGTIKEGASNTCTRGIGYIEYSI